MLICTKDIQQRCPYSVMCEEACKIAEDSDCADFIRQLFADALMEPPDDDPVEAEYLLDERQAIQEETLRDFAPKYLCMPYAIREYRGPYTVVDEFFETPEWRKDNPMLRGTQKPSLPREMPLPEKKREPARCPVTLKAPLFCRIAYRLTCDSPSAVLAGCMLGRRAVFYKDCAACPKYRGPFKISKREKEAE